VDVRERLSFPTRRSSDLKALTLTDAKDEVYYQIAALYQTQGHYEKAIHYLRKCLKVSKDNQEALYEIAFCYDVLDKQTESIEFRSEEHTSELQSRENLVC